MNKMKKKTKRKILLQWKIKLDFTEEQESAPTDNQYNNHIHDDL